MNIWITNTSKNCHKSTKCHTISIDNSGFSNQRTTSAVSYTHLRQVINVIADLDLGDYEESHAFGEIYETILKELQSAGSSGEFYTPRAVTEDVYKRQKLP